MNGYETVKIALQISISCVTTFNASKRPKQLILLEGHAYSVKDIPFNDDNVCDMSLESSSKFQKRLRLLQSLKTYSDAAYSYRCA